MTNSNIKNDLLKAIKNSSDNQNIIAYFRGCLEPIAYTMAIYNLLITDPDTEVICDAATGEILYKK